MNVLWLTIHYYAFEYRSHFLLSSTLFNAASESIVLSTLKFFVLLPLPIHPIGWGYESIKRELYVVLVVVPSVVCTVTVVVLVVVPSIVRTVTVVEPSVLPSAVLVLSGVAP